MAQPSCGCRMGALTPKAAAAAAVHTLLLLLLLLPSSAVLHATWAAAAVCCVASVWSNIPPGNSAPSTAAVADLQARTVSLWAQVPVSNSTTATAVTRCTLAAPRAAAVPMPAVCLRRHDAP